LGVPFIELDREIEKRSGTTLSEIFDMFGQETFRRAEHEALDDVLPQHKDFVIATSGSIVTEPGQNRKHMKRVMAQGDMRPMANNIRAMDDLISILRSREPLYAKAEVALATTGKTPEQNLTELLRIMALPIRAWRGPVAAAFQRLAKRGRDAGSREYSERTRSRPLPDDKYE
jgi:XRE family aerobic/anaerobic benzoate catabolism transcriptional regulator